MNYRQIRKDAMKYAGDDACYIHCEKAKGGNPEIVLCGDFLAMSLSISGQINRLSELTHTSYEDTVNIISEIQKVGYNYLKGILGETTKSVKGNDPYADVESELTHKDSAIAEYRQANEKLLSENEKLKKELEEKEYIISRLKDKMASKEKEENKKVKDLSKEVLRLEHRLQEMENAIIKE